MLCPRCQHANPDEAKYCHFDGAELRAGGNGAYQGGELGREFVFPTGRRCRTFDELVRGCSEDWDAARSMLRQGSLRQFMAGIGRMDLAQLAEKASTDSDPDVALDSFLSQLPALDVAGPRLDLLPRRLNIGKMAVGQTKQYTLTIFNQGTRLLLGSIQVEGAEWIRIGPEAGRTVAIKASKQQSFNVAIDPSGLPSGQKYSGKLTVITNGGVAEVPVRLDLQPAAFPKQPLQGATNPRDLASRMKDQPRAAAPLLENGEVERWFQANGWNYPVQGPQAQGVAAVQQFFEAMGLSKPPPLSVSEQEIWLSVCGTQKVPGQMWLRTAAKKWVYAHVDSDSAWLTVLTPDIGGAQQAMIEFEASAKEVHDDRPREAYLTITGNGGQRFRVTVHGDLRPQQGVSQVPLWSGILSCAVIGFLIRLILAVPDAWVRGTGQFGSWITDAPPDYVGHFCLATFWIGAAMTGWWVYQRNGLRDIVAGLVTGAAAGVALGATAATVIQPLEAAMRRSLPVDWFAIALFGWAAWGAILGVVLPFLGKPGRRVVFGCKKVFAHIAGRLGLGGLSQRVLQD